MSDRARITRELPPDARRSLRVYNLLFPLAFLALLPGYFMRMYRRGNFREKFGQRLGRYSAADRARLAGKRRVWIHSISVGETFIALKLARAIHAADPGVLVLLSTTTTTGFAEAAKSASDWLEPIYNPLDLRGNVSRVLDLLAPEMLIVIEGGLWPNLIAEAHRRGIPLALVNARMSPRSERRFRRFREWIGPIFRLLDVICVPDPGDIDRWESIGAQRGQLHCTGSIKFDDPVAAPQRDGEFRTLLAPLGVTRETPIVLGGSTWAPEEAMLAKIARDLRAEFPGLFLIIVPRHVERSAEVESAIRGAGLRVVRRSQLPGATEAEALLVDVTGELRDWYALATVVFVGKSMPGIAQVGGQNPAEPALLEKPVIVGPHMENFATLIAHLRERDGVAQVETEAALREMITTLLRDRERGRAMGTRAKAALEAHRGATLRTLELLRQLTASRAGR